MSNAHRTILFCSFICVLLMTHGVIRIKSLYHEEEARAQEQSANRAAYIQELLEQDSRTILANMRLAGGLASLESVDRTEIESLEWTAPLVRTTIAIDPSGDIFADSRVDQPALGRNVVDRDYFSHHRRSGRSDVYVGANVRSRVDGYRSLPFSLAIRKPPGDRLVAVVASAIDPVAWSRTIGDRLGPSRHEIAVVDREGTVLFTHPFDEGMLGKSLAAFEDARRAVADPPSGPFAQLSESLFEHLRAPGTKDLASVPLSFKFYPSTVEWSEHFLEHALRETLLQLLLIALVAGAGNYLIRVSARADQLKNQLIDSIEASSEGIALFDRDDRMVLCNQLFRDFYKHVDKAGAIAVGTRFEDMLRIGLAAGVFSKAEGREDEWLAERLRQHQLTEKTEQRLADGRWLLISERRLSDGGIIGVRTDITALKNRETEILESERRLRDFTATASDWAWETGPDHRFSYISGTAIEDWEDGGPFAAKGHSRSELADEDTQSAKWAEHDRVMNAHEPFKDFRYWVRRENGERRYVSISGIPLFDPDGAFRGYRGTGRDITEEYEIKERSKALEEQFQVAFQSVTIGLVLADETGTITAINPAATQIFGYAENEVLGRNVSMLAEPEVRDAHDGYLHNYRVTGCAKIIGSPRDVMGRRKNGELFPLKLGLAHMTLGTEQQYIASITDLSTERALETQLRQAQKMDAVGQLVGGVSHDFNNLLGIIIGNLELVAIDAEPGSVRERQLRNALGAASRGAALTRRLLNVSRQYPVQAATIDVHQTLTDLKDLLQKSITHVIPITLRLESLTPTIAVEQGDLEDAIVNLCLNAKDAMPDGGEIVIATRDLERKNEGDGNGANDAGQRFVQIEVSDTGGGIAPDSIDKVFDPFFTTKERGKGTGLGLSMVYGFARRAGGDVSVSSELGTGTTVRLIFPVSRETPAVGIAGGEAEPAACDDGRGELVLIVDDEAEIAEVAEAVLEEHGYETLRAHSGSDAVAILKERDDISVLFSDVVMPGGMDGYQLLKKARDLRPSLSLSLSSGFSGQNKRNRIGLEGVPTLKKPYSNNSLVKFIKTVVEERR